MYNTEDYRRASFKISKYVPRGTFEKLKVFVELVLQWNKKINLISRKSEEFIWSHHVLDSLCALPHLIQSNSILLDVGTGAGFPGLVLSIATGQQTILAERSQKKCAFLKEAQQVTGANVIIENKPIEKVAGYRPSVILSRGFGSVHSFLQSISHLIRQDLQVITWKGDRGEVEVEEARVKPWHFDAAFKRSPDMRGMLALLSNFTKA